MAQIQPDHLSDSSSDSALAILLRHVDMSMEQSLLRRVPHQPRHSPEQDSDALCEDHPEHGPDQYGCFGQDGNIAAIECAVCCEDIKVHNKVWMVH